MIDPSDPDPADVESEFVTIDDEYDRSDFFGGAFEGSHHYGPAVALRLYAIVDGDDEPTLRIETRYHYGGDVVDHRRTTRDLDEDRRVDGTDEPLATFCRRHHFDSPCEEIRDVIERGGDANQ